ncbi:MAG: cysteine desulfurase family protein [Bacteroidota bacterium]
MQRIYLDHTATTPVDPLVVEAMRPYWGDIHGNPSSIHWFGQRAKEALEKARETIAGAIGAEPGELFFTSGGTESDNAALRGAACAARERGRNHLVTSKAEHHAVLDTIQELVGEGFRSTVLDVDEVGRVPLSDIESALTPQTVLVSLMHANNEVGTVNPLAEITGPVRNHGVFFHTDAVQTLGKLPVDVDTLGVDLLSVSAHKLYGPKGIGALYVRKGTDLEPILHGGGQERGMRPGTENVALAVGFAKAVELSTAAMASESASLAGLRNRLEMKIKDRYPEVLLNGDPKERLPHILNVSFDSEKIALEGEMLVMNMDLEGIAVTSGSACTSGSMQPSHVLLALGRDPETAKATLRFSFGRGNTEEDVEAAIKALQTVVERMRR